MTLVDANLLLYATVSDFSQHAASRAWLEGRLNDTGRVGMAWSSLLAFLRIATNPRIFTRPLGIGAAWQRVDEWLAQPNVWVPTPTEQHASVLGKLLIDGRVAGNLIPDAHLAALAIEHGLVLYSTDGDFARFPDLRWENPVAG